jgi:hypothetical protein
MYFFMFQLLLDTEAFREFLFYSFKIFSKVKSIDGDAWYLKKFPQP